jgi:hypothetical protein
METWKRGCLGLFGNHSLDTTLLRYCASATQALINSQRWALDIFRAFHWTISL